MHRCRLPGPNCSQPVSESWNCHNIKDVPNSLGSASSDRLTTLAGGASVLEEHEAGRNSGDDGASVGRSSVEGADGRGTSREGVSEADG